MILCKRGKAEEALRRLREIMGKLKQKRQGTKSREAGQNCRSALWVMEFHAYKYFTISEKSHAISFWVSFLGHAGMVAWWGKCCIEAGASLMKLCKSGFLTLRAHANLAL